MPSTGEVRAIDGGTTAGGEWLPSPSRRSDPGQHAEAEPPAGMEDEVFMTTRKLTYGHAVVLATAGAILVATLVIPSSASQGKNGRIAFIFSTNGLGDVYTMNPDGTDVQQLTSLPPNTTANGPWWSPDGCQIVFTINPPQNAPSQLWLMNRNGSNQHPLFSDSSYNDFSASFSPDGKTLVFGRCPPGPEGCAIYRVNVDGTGLTAITHFKHEVLDFNPVYSPDGQKIAFASIARGGVIIAVYVMNADGTDMHQLTPSWVGANLPDWSPDGNKVLFSSNGSVDHVLGFVFNEELWVINTDGTGLTSVTRTNEHWHGYLNSPHDLFGTWSPDGDAIVFWRNSPDFGKSAIYVINPDGSGLRQLLDLPIPPQRAAELRGRTTLRGRSPWDIRRIEVGGSDAEWGPNPEH